MTRRFFLSLFGALAALPALAFRGVRTFRSRWFAKPQQLGNWSENGHFGGTSDKLRDAFEKCIREAGPKEQYLTVSQEEYDLLRSGGPHDRPRRDPARNR